MALNGIQIFKLTPKKNCKECGCPTCMAFSMKVAQGAMKIEQCPHMSDEAIASLSEATAPPMKSIKIGAGENEYSLGGETVLFRHEKTFVSKARYAVNLCTCMDDAAVEAKLAEIPKVDYERIGERMHAEVINVRCDESADCAKYVELVKKAAGLGRTLVLDVKNVEIAKAALAE
ncbi:MAG: acetyl-CoA synthase subunit gamma, partial [Blautia sp.]|nr:acetyl-CoA synthase subunit gamma [Blautia sp.]